MTIYKLIAARIDEIVDERDAINFSESAAQIKELEDELNVLKNLQNEKMFHYNSLNQEIDNLTKTIDTLKSLGISEDDSSLFQKVKNFIN